MRFAPRSARPIRLTNPRSRNRNSRLPATRRKSVEIQGSDSAPHQSEDSHSASETATPSRRFTTETVPTGEKRAIAGSERTPVGSDFSRHAANMRNTTSPSSTPQALRNTRQKAYSFADETSTNPPNRYAKNCACAVFARPSDAPAYRLPHHHIPIIIKSKALTLLRRRFRPNWGIMPGCAWCCRWCIR